MTQTQRATDILRNELRAWIEAVGTRRSRRRFDGRKPGEPLLAELTRLAEEFRPYPDARVVVLADPPPELFTGLVGSYGKIRGAVSAALFVRTGDDGARDVGVGYTGEAFMLGATALGVDTCWVAGAFDRRIAADLPCLERGDVVLAISPLGYAEAQLPVGERMMRGMVRADSRKPLDTIAPGSAAWPEWAQRAVELARLAPSASNRQPWRFAFDGSGLNVSAAGLENPVVSRRLDVGIAMLHATLGAEEHGIDGSWVDEHEPTIARFAPNGVSR